MVREGAVLLLVATAPLPQAAAQTSRVETQGSQAPAISAGGNVSVAYGLTAEQIRALVHQENKENTAELERLSKALGVTEAAAQAVLLQRMKLHLPAQPPPRIAAANVPVAA